VNAPVHPYLYVAVFHLLGSFSALCVLRGGHLLFCVSSGLLWGLAIHTFLALAALLISYLAGHLPFYDAALMLPLVLLVTAGAATLCFLRAGRWRLSVRRVVAAQTTALAILALATALALRWNLSVLSVDSFAFVELGLAFARISDAPHLGLHFLHSWPIFAVLLHATTDLARVEYLYFLMPVVSLAFVTTLAGAAVQTILLLGRSPRVAAVATLLGMTWLLTCYLVVFYLFYIHTNWLAAIYVFLFFFTAWMALQTEERSWFALAAAAAFAFALVRVEAPLFLALFLCFLATQETGGRQGLRPILALALPASLWCLCLCAILGDAGGIVDRGRLLVMVGGLLASIALAGCMRFASFRRRASWLQLSGLATLAAVFVLMLIDRPEHMLEKSRVHLLNALVYGYWSTAWLLVAALALAAPLLGRMPHQRFVWFGVAGFLIVSFDLTYFGHWRQDWGDSGNRMLTHVLPTIAWALMVTGAAVVPRRAPSVPDSGCTRPGPASSMSSLPDR
jgi:hypothetical protein